MSCFAELNVGVTFGYWVVIGRGYKTNYVKCLCICGDIVDVYVSSLKSERSISCGCHRRKVLIEDHTIHNEAKESTKTKEYRAWSAMKNRCYNTNGQDYMSYGGRGIRVHDTWRGSYPLFLKDVGRAPDPTYSLDRYPDNNGNYEPGNCRWATPKQQANNRRVRRLRVTPEQ